MEQEEIKPATGENRLRAAAMAMAVCMSLGLPLGLSACGKSQTVQEEENEDQDVTYTGGSFGGGYSGGHFGGFHTVYYSSGGSWRTGSYAPESSSFATGKSTTAGTVKAPGTVKTGGYSGSAKSGIGG